MTHRDHRALGKCVPALSGDAPPGNSFFSLFATRAGRGWSITTCPALPDGTGPPRRCPALSPPSDLLPRTAPKNPAPQRRARGPSRTTPPRPPGGGRQGAPTDRSSATWGLGARVPGGAQTTSTGQRDGVWLGYCSGGRPRRCCGLPASPFDAAQSTATAPLVRPGSPPAGGQPQRPPRSTTTCQPRLARCSDCSGRQTHDRKDPGSSGGGPSWSVVDRTRARTSRSFLRGSRPSPSSPSTRPPYRVGRGPEDGWSRIAVFFAPIWGADRCNST
jgi:hypothetical protein